MATGWAPEMRNNLPNDSQVRNGGCVDDDRKRGAVSEMKQDFDGGCVDEDAGGAVSEMVKGPR